MLNIQSIILVLKISYFKFNYCPFVVIEITVIGRWKYCYDCWELFLSSPMIHFKAISLGLMCPNNWEKTIFCQKVFYKLVSKEIGAASNLVALDNSSLKFSGLIIDWVSPHKITKETTLRDFLKTINILNIVKLKSVKYYIMNALGDTAVDT